MRNMLMVPILETGALEMGEFLHRSGAYANNKVNTNAVRDHEPTRKKVVDHTCDKLDKYNLQAIVSTPKSADWFAAAVGLELAKPVIYLNSELQPDGTKIFDYRTRDDETLAMETDRLGIAENVFNKFTSTLGVLAVKGIAERAEVAFAIWDRGCHPSRTDLIIPHHALVEKYIPNYISPDDDSLYPYGQRVMHDLNS